MRGFCVSSFNISNLLILKLCLIINRMEKIKTEIFHSDDINVSSYRKKVLLFFLNAINNIKNK